MPFDNATLNFASIILFVLLVFAIGSLIAFFKSKKESNSLKYPGTKRLSKYKFSEPPIEEYEKDLAK